MTDKVLYWLELADYDLETARMMLKTKRYVYVGFMCHQTVEKAMKAVVASTGVFPPKVHSLDKLVTVAKLDDKLSEEQKAVLTFLEPMNLESRYPDAQRSIAKRLTAQRCRDLVVETEEFLCWIKAML